MSITLIQSKSKRSSLTSDTLAFNSNVTTGSAVIVAVSGNGNPSTFSVSDGVNTYSSLSEVDINGSAISSSRIFYCLNATGGAITVSVSCTSGQVLGIAIHEFSGLVGLDVHNSGTGNLSNSQSSGNVTTNIATELLLGFTSLNYASGTVLSITPETGWTQAETQPSVSSDGYLSQYNVVSSTGTYAATSTNTNGKGSGAPTWTCQIATFAGAFDAMVNLTGVSSSTAIGTPAVKVAKLLTGVSSTTHVGSLTVTGTANVALTGVLSTSHVGIPTLPVGAVGVSSTALSGTVTVTGDANATGSITPVATHVGTLTITGTAALTLTGVSSTILVGTAVAQVKVLPTGVSSTSHIGSTSIALAKTLTGIQSTSHVGTPTVATTEVILLIGIQVTCSVGLPLVTCNSAFPMIAFLGL